MSCSAAWAAQILDLPTGRIVGNLDPISLSFTNTLSDPGSGSVTLDRYSGRRAADVWPHRTSIALLRLTGPGASPDAPRCEFIGMVDSIRGATLGLVGLPQYWYSRLMHGTTRWDQVPHTELARDLAALCSGPDGIPAMQPAAGPSGVLRDRGWFPWDLKNIGDAIEQLTQVINGPEYVVDWVLSGDRWITRPIFVDRAGADTDLLLRGDVATSIDVAIDGRDHCTMATAVGAGEEEETLLAQAEDTPRVYPVFEAAPAHKDVSRPSTLLSHAEGYVAQLRDPIAVPSLTFSGWEPSPQGIALGDTLNVDIRDGFVSYVGRARVRAIAWAADADTTARRTFTLTPEGRSLDAVARQAYTPPECG